jgi:hypothetical protein
VPFRRRRPQISILLLVYVGIGIAVAASHHYFQDVHGWRAVLSAIFAIFLWPLILLGIDLHVKR